MPFTKEWWAKKKKEKEEKVAADLAAENRAAELNEHLAKVSVDGVEIPMKMGKEKEMPQKAEPVLPVQEDPTLSLKLTIAELQVDHLAHSFLIASVYKSYSALGLPEHLAQVEIERLVAPHRNRVADIETVLRQFDGQ